MDIARYLLLRLLRMVFTLVLVISLTFFLFRAVPGGPASVLIGPDLDPSVQDSLRARFGLDEPIAAQYLQFLKNVFTGNLGISFSYQVPVGGLLVSKLAHTMALALPAMIIGTMLGVVAGVESASRYGRWYDRLSRWLSLAVKSSPEFWLATLALIAFSYALGLFPTGGMVDPGTNKADRGFGYLVTGDFLHHLALPLLVLTTIFIIWPFMTMRSSMLAVMAEDFVDLSRAQGFSRNRILYKHASRSALLPMISLIPGITGFLVGGDVVIERVFSWPGMGNQIVQAVNSFDYPVMQGAFIMMAALVIFMNTLADIAYTYADPRVGLT